MSGGEHPFEYYEWLEYINKRIVKISDDEGTSETIKSAMDKDSDSRNSTFGVTEIVNPMQAYYRRLYPQMPEDPDVIEKLEYGTGVHNLAFYWLKYLDGSVVREIDINGSANGLEGVKGRLDFRTSEGIVEFKTTTHTINSEEDVLSQNPHDIEQLITYAIITSSTGENNRLIYFSEELEGEFRVFSVRIKDGESLSLAIRERKESLESALEKNAPDELGQCRYLDTGCKFNLSGICSCGKERRIDDSHLRNYAEIIRDTSFEDRLREAKSAAKIPQTPRLSLWDMFTPRKAYIKKIGEFVQKMPESEANNGLSLRNIERGIRNTGYYMGSREIIVNGTSLGYSWGMKDHGQGSGHPDVGQNEYAPVITRISSKFPQEINEGTVSPHYLARLGMICAATGSSSGYVAMGFKNSDTDLKCYRVEFDDVAPLKEEMERRVSEITEAFENDDVSKLPKCPIFVRKSCGSNCLCTDK